MNMYQGVVGKKITGVEPKGTHLVIVLEDESRLIIVPGASFNIDPDGHLWVSRWQHVRLEKPGESSKKVCPEGLTNCNCIDATSPPKLEAPDGFVEE